MSFSQPEVEPDQPTTRLAFTAYRVSDEPFDILPATGSRSWMDSTPDRYAYRCLPMDIANQSGWFITTGVEVRATWSGGEEQEALEVTVDAQKGHSIAGSHFGSGILTWHIPFLFRTAPGYNLLVRGPSNWPIDGVYALEGVVEADWAVSTFTMNWKFTRPHHQATFCKGFPVAMLVPQLRYELERFDPIACSIEGNRELAEAYHAWSNSRDKFNKELQDPGSTAVQLQWQKHYFRGMAPSGLEAPQHQVKLNVQPFTVVE